MRIGRIALFVWGLLLFGGLTESAFAWGPGTHIGLGCSVLGQLSLLPAPVALVIARNAIAYLYGNIAADVVFAKKLSRVKQFCHHWATGFRLLEQAEDERSKAFAYGYLSHLAADTVAHGKYVPRQLALSDCSMNFGHFYWELRADALEEQETWNVVRKLLQQDHDQHHDMLEEHLTETFLNYNLNRSLFQRMNSFASRETFIRTIDLWGKLSRWDLPQNLLEGYRSESVDRVLAVLSRGDRSTLVREDPNGSSALSRAQVEKKSVRRMRRGGLCVERRLREISMGFAPCGAHE